MTSPRNGGKPLGSDCSLTTFTNTVGTLCDSAKRDPHINQEAGLVIENSSGQLAIYGILRLITLLWTSIDRDAIPPTERLFGPCLGSFQDSSEIDKSRSCH